MNPPMWLRPGVATEPTPSSEGASKPITLLSFIYNTTGSPAYRTEMHMDMGVAFDRFKVTDAQTRESCFKVEKAAYELRVFSSDAKASIPIDGERYRKAGSDLKVSVADLFAALEKELGNFVRERNYDEPNLGREIDPTRTGQPVVGFGTVVLVPEEVKVAPNGWHLLLDYVYYFFHFRRARAAIRLDTAGVVAALKKIGEADRADAVVRALFRVGEVLDGRDNPDVDAEIGIICDALAREYEDRGWLTCW
jgi:hypothetical protein